MEEQWKTINGFEDYCISSYGRVWSNKTRKILTPVIRSKTCPYYSVCLLNKERQVTYPIHRLVAEYFLGSEPKAEVNHIDGDKKNNNVSNLEWVTKSENANHAFKLGLRKNKPSQIEKAIKSRQRPIRNIESGNEYESIAECARSMNVKKSGISKCLNGTRPHYMGLHFEYIG